MENTEKKAENQTEKTDATKTGIVEHKKSLDSLAAQKVDGDNVLGGISAKFNNMNGNRTLDDSQTGNG